MLSVSVTLEIKPEEVDRFLSLFQAVIAGAAADEEGCLQYDLSRSAEHSTVFHVYEVYRDAAALEAHRASPHFVAWSAVASEVVQRDGRVTRIGEIVSRNVTDREGN